MDWKCSCSTSLKHTDFMPDTSTREQIISVRQLIEIPHEFNMTETMKEQV